MINADLCTNPGSKAPGGVSRSSASTSCAATASRSSRTRAKGMPRGCRAPPTTIRFGGFVTRIEGLSPPLSEPLSEQEHRAQDSTGGGTDRRADQSSFEARVIAAAAFAVDHGAEITTRKEAADRAYRAAENPSTNRTLPGACRCLSLGGGRCSPRLRSLPPFSAAPA